MSTFRKQIVDFLADIDERYAFKKASRMSLRESDGSTSGDKAEASADGSEIEASDEESDSNIE